MDQSEVMRWLVRFQVLGESFDAIAADAGRDVAEVRTAVVDAAALVGLPLRDESAE